MNDKGRENFSLSRTISRSKKIANLFGKITKHFKAHITRNLDRYFEEQSLLMKLISQPLLLLSFE